MKLKFIAADLSYSIDSICSFQEASQGDFFKEPLFMLYPQIDAKKYRTFSSEDEKRAFLAPVLTEIYNENEADMKEKAKEYQKLWDENNSAVQGGLEKVFELSLSGLFNGMQARVGINPVGPRYLHESSFDIIHLFSPRGAVVISIHEIIHFIWFYVWNRHFNDEMAEYENPHLKWVFSEMVPDMIMKKAGLGFLNPQGREMIYPYFHNIDIGGNKIIDIITVMMESGGIAEFMEKGYDFCLENENKIRAVMH